MDPQDRIDMVMEYASEHPRFDTTFIESLQDALNQYGSLTHGQSAALDNIIAKFGIE